jgi:hypothetical protein
VDRFHGRARLHAPVACCPRVSLTVQSWWSFLCALAAFNIAAWLLAAVALERRRQDVHPDSFAVHRRLLILSGFYVFGCAFRSAFPVYDIPRICVVDSWLSSVLVGRSVATVAELCFAAQWALFLRECARASGSRAVHAVSQSIVPLIVIAETCSWYAVLTTANLGHVFENSLWGLSAALIVVSLIAIAPQWPARSRAILGIWAAGGIVYVAYMFIVDVPLYWSRWIADEAVAREYLSITQGVIDASACKITSLRWEDWRHEVVWMTLYFSGGAWTSISLILANLRGNRTAA